MLISIAAVIKGSLGEEVRAWYLYSAGRNYGATAEKGKEVLNFEGKEV